MKLKFTFFIAFLFLFTTRIFSQGIVNDIKLDTLKKYLREISGDTQTIIDGNTYTILTRNTNNKASNYIAAKYIKFRLQSYGLPVTEQIFTYNGGVSEAKNVYAVQTGSVYPNKKFIICAHFDNMPGTSTAPGADDNGSGTVAVLEAARVISKLNPQYTIVYALWSGEEQGLLGSKYYATLAKANQEDIVGVMNMDMIAWDADFDNNVEIYYRAGVQQALMDAMLNKLSAVNTGYGLGLVVRKIATVSANSDHHPFIDRGYPGFLMIEEFSDFNSYYHTVNDNYTNIFPYLGFFEKCAKLAIISLAELSGAIQVPTKADDIAALPSDLVLSQNYPNPFNPATVISYSLKEGNNVRLSVFDALGREVKTLVDEYKPAGNHQAIFSVESGSATSGVYFYRLQSGSSMLMKKMVYLK